MFLDIIFYNYFHEQTIKCVTIHELDIMTHFKTMYMTVACDRDFYDTLLFCHIILP